jgi:hypothetical protein
MEVGNEKNLVIRHPGREQREITHEAECLQEVAWLQEKVLLLQACQAGAH